MTTLIYIGRGAALIGVPARNLTKAEIEALPDGFTLEILLGSGLYKRPVELKQDAVIKPRLNKLKKEGE